MPLNDIDYYIKQTDIMENCSAGGSACYSFDDNVVLVKHIARGAYQPFEYAEKIAEWVNKKNEKGVKIPKYLAIKRTEENGTGVCWVLQEKAKGINKAVSYSSEVLKAPDSHYEQLVSDMCELIDSGFERKSKNIFYDSDTEKGGFTLIDFTIKNPRDFNNTFSDVYNVYIWARDVVKLNDWRGKRWFTEQENMEASRRVFMAMEKVIPNFEHHRRNLLRRIDEETLDYFSTHEVDVGDLTLTIKEQKQFEIYEQKALLSVLEDIKSGAIKPDWDKISGEIRKRIYDISDNWAKHPENSLKRENYGDFNNFFKACNNVFHKQATNTFVEMLMNCEDANNANLAQAKAAAENHITKEQQQVVSHLKNRGYNP
jgi:hypothetical protein